MNEEIRKIREEKKSEKQTFKGRFHASRPLVVFRRTQERFADGVPWSDDAADWL